MKKTISFILALCLCVGLCACGSEKEAESKDDANASRFEDTLVETVRIGDPLSNAEKALGAPLSSEKYEGSGNYTMHYTYKDVSVFGLNLTPHVYTDAQGNVVILGYYYESKTHSAAYEDAYAQIVANFIRIYGEPDTSKNTPAERPNSNQWLFENGSRLIVNNFGALSDTYYINIELSPKK